MNTPMRSRRTYSLPFVLVILMSGLFLTSQASAQPGSGQGMEQIDNTPAMGKKGKRHCKQRGEHTPVWKQSLSDEQQAAMKQIKLAYMKQKLPLKARKTALKVELMALATADNPNGAAIDAKINELLGVKKSLMLAKTRKIADIRALLSEEQRAEFDLYLLKKAKHGKKKCSKCRGHQ